MGTSFEEIYELFIFDVREFKEYYDYTEEDLQYEFKHILQKSIYNIYPAKIEDLEKIFAYQEYFESVSEDESVLTEDGYMKPDIELPLINVSSVGFYFDNELTSYQKQTLVNFMVIEWLKSFTNSSNILLSRHNTSEVSQSSPAAKLNSLISARKERLVEFEHNVNRQTLISGKNPFLAEEEV